MLCVAGCGSKGNDSGKDVVDTSNTSDTINTASQSESSKGEETEADTEIEPETKKNYIKSMNLVENENYNFLLDYKDVIVSYFDNKVLSPGEVINVRDELNNTGYSLEEYGKVFGAIYFIIYLYPEYFFEIIENNEKNFLYYPIIDDVNNYAYKVTDEDPITINIEFDDNGNMTLTLTTY